MAENEAVEPQKKEGEEQTPEESFVVNDTYAEGEEDSGIETYSEIPVPQPSKSKHKDRAINSAIKASSEGSNPIEAYQTAYLSEDYDVFATASANTRQAVFNELKGISQAPNIDTNRAAEHVKGIVKKSQEGILAPFYAQVMSLPQAALLSKEEVDEAAYYSYLQNSQAEIWDGMSKFEVASDFFTMMVAPDQNMRMKDLSDYLHLDFNGKDLLDTTEFQAKVFTSIGKLPVEQRAQLIKDVVDRWESFGIFDNKLQALTFLTRSTSFTEEEQVTSHFEELMDRTDQATMVLGLGTTLFKGLGKAGTLIRQAARLKDIEGVRVAAKSAMAGATKELGVDAIDGATSVQPFSEVTKLVHGADNTLANEILQMDEEVEAIVKAFNPLDLSLSTKDKERAIDLAIKRIEKHENVVEAKVLNYDGKTYEIGYKTQAGEEKWKRGTFTMDDVGMWEESKRTVKGVPFVASPNHRFASIRDDIVQTPFRGILEGSKMKKSFDEFIRKGLKGIDKKGFDKVDQMLTIGANKEKTFSYAEAVEQGIDGMKLTPKEYKGYMTIRKSYDALHALKDKELVASKMSRGIRNILLDGQEHSGKVYEYSDAAVSSYTQAKTRSKVVLKADEATGMELDTDKIKDLYNQGYKLVRADGNNLFSKHGTFYEWVAVKADDVSDIKRGILGRVEGYIPRIREGGNFFLKSTEEVDVAGTPAKIEKTYAYSRNYQDLEDYRKSLDKADEFVVRSDRELSGDVLAEDHLRVMGGLFTGGRKSELLPYIGSGTEKLASPITGLQRYINSVSRSMPMNIFREGLKQKWINTAKDAGVLKGYRGNESFAELLHKIDDTHEASRFFRASHGECAFITGIPSEAETIFNTNLIKVGRWIEKNGKIPFGKKIAQGFYENKIQDVQSLVKTATYHSMLGFGNIAQTLVQGSGAMVALSTNPVHGAKGLSHALDFMLLDQIGKKFPYEEVVSKFGKKVDMDCWKLWDKSGMRENIAHANVDYNSVFSDAPYDAGVVRKLLANSDFFVQSGEMFYSRTSFGTAYEFVKKQLGRTPNEGDLAAIINRAEDYRMNMSRANMAKFQKGVMSIPTQFFQVQTKFIEKMVGSDFTLAEKLRLGGAQVALYGAAGAPVVGTIIDPFLDMLGINAEELTEDELRLYKKGMVGHLLTTGFDVHTDFGGRVSLGSDLAERVLKTFLGDTSVVELASGPSYEWIKKSEDLWQNLCAMNSLMIHSDDLDSATVFASAKVISQELMNIPSSTRNMLKGYTMMNSGMYRNRAGKSVFEYQDNNWQTSLAQAIGLSANEVSDWYEIGGTIDPFSDRSQQKTMAQSLASITIKMINSGAKEQTVYLAAFNTLRSAIGTSPNGDKVMKQYEDFLSNPDSSWNEQFVKGLKNYQDELQTGLSALFRRARVRTNPRLAGEMEKIRGEEE